jgi:hypothetical protein
MVCRMSLCARHFVVHVGKCWPKAGGARLIAYQILGLRLHSLQEEFIMIGSDKQF